MRRFQGISTFVPVLGLVAACGEPEREAPAYGTAVRPIDAYCQAQVDGQGVVDVETDYIPHVVACENGSADFEALRAQAVAARSYLYYKLETAGRIGDGQHDQVYSCAREPGPEHLEAAASTSGQILRYNGQTVAAFYVAGAIPSTADCVPAPGDRDPTNTEHWVTYNQGRSGDDLIQTELGWVNRGNFRNRGCKSQNGANCLSRAGRLYDEIIRFYYGEDIGLETAVGACVGPVEPPPACDTRIDGAGGVVDDRDRCFTRTCAPGNSWYDIEAGHDGHLFMTFTDDTPEPACTGRWQLGVTAEGDYEVAAFVADYGPPLSRQARYVVRHAGQESEVVIDQEGRNDWVSLGTFRFVAAAPEEQWVLLPDNTGEPYMGEDGIRLVYDAVRLTPAAPPPPPPADGATPPPPPPDDDGATPPPPERDTGVGPPPPPPEGDAGPAGPAPRRTDGGASPDDPRRFDGGLDDGDGGTFGIERVSRAEHDGGCAQLRGPLPVWWSVGALGLLAAAARRRRR